MELKIKNEVGKLSFMFPLNICIHLGLQKLTRGRYFLNENDCNFLKHIILHTNWSYLFNVLKRDQVNGSYTIYSTSEIIYSTGKMLISAKNGKYKSYSSDFSGICCVTENDKIYVLYQNEKITDYHTPPIQYNDDIERFDLSIEGEMNSSDVHFMRSLCGGGYNRIEKFHRSLVGRLDLSDAIFVNDNTAYYKVYSRYIGNREYKTKSQIVTSYMFSNFGEMDCIILPKNIKKVNRDAFWSCNAKEIVFPETIETLDTSSVECCAVQNLNVNANEIKAKSFFLCKQLRSLILGRNVKHINGAFGYNQDFEEIVLAPNNKELNLEYNTLFNKKGNQLILHVQQEDSAVYQVPEGVERICGGAFQSKYTLEEIELPHSLKYIGEGAFQNTDIKTIHIWENVKEISNMAFPSSLEYIYFHSMNVPKMKECFTINVNNVNLKRIYVPKGKSEDYKLGMCKYYGQFIVEEDYSALTAITEKAVKNRAFYVALKQEIDKIEPMYITSLREKLPQGRFAQLTFEDVWSKNLYYIKWMIRLFKIIDIRKEVFDDLKAKYPMKVNALHNLYILLQKARKLKEDLDEELNNQYMIEEEQQRLLNEAMMDKWNIEESNKEFEQMMDDFEAWGNID